MIITSMKETDRDLRWKVNGHMRGDILAETQKMGRILSFSKGGEQERGRAIFQRSSEGEACSKA